MCLSTFSRRARCWAPVALVKQRPKRSVDRLRHSSSSCECASPARSAFYFIGSSFGISYEIKKTFTRKRTKVCTSLTTCYCIPAYEFPVTEEITVRTYSPDCFQLLQLGSDVQIYPTCTGLPPSPARFTFQINLTVFVNVFWSFFTISRLL